EFAEKITLSVPEGLVLRHSGADDARRLRNAAVKAERQELIRLWRENQISDDVLHHIEEDLDYQESRIYVGGGRMVRVAVFALFARAALPRAAQYPDRNVTFLANFPPGVLVDIVTRVVAV